MKVENARRLPRSDQAWEMARDLQRQTLNRSTKTGRTGAPFTFMIHEPDEGEFAIWFFRDGRKVKSASRNRFGHFYDQWRGGSESADDFQNAGRLRTKAQVAHFLIPVFEAIARKNSML